MWYPVSHASTIMYPTARHRRASRLGSRVALVVRLYLSPLPDAAGECRRSAYHRDCPHPTLQRPDRTQRDSRFPAARTSGFAVEIIAPPHHAGRVDRPRPRTAARAATPKPAHLRQRHQHLDLELAAEVSFAEGITARQVSGETIRSALKQLGMSWKRAKHWISSPDPDYVRKKNGATD